MKKLFAILLALGVGATVLTAQDAPADKAPADQPAQEMKRPGGGRREFSPEQMKERQGRRFRQAAAELKEMYDANQDGVIDPQEREKLDADLATVERLQRYILPAKAINAVDADRNLELSDEELAKLPEAMKSLRPEMGPGRGARPNGPRGDRPNGARGDNRRRPPQDGGPDDDGGEPPAPPED